MKHPVRMAVASAMLSSVAAMPAFAASEIDELRAILEAQQDEIDALKKGSTGLGGNTHLGGYGELHYNNLDNQLDGGSDKKQMDFHRFVLYINHDYSDSIRLNTEFELEHSLAGEGKPGEVELEQAYIDFDLYEPCLKALEFSDSRLSVGGMIILDEALIETWKGEGQALREFLASRKGDYEMSSNPISRQPTVFLKKIR